MNLIASQNLNTSSVSAWREWRQLRLSIAPALLFSTRTLLPASGTLVTLPMAPSNSH